MENKQEVKTNYTSVEVTICDEIVRLETKLEKAKGRKTPNKFSISILEKNLYEHKTILTKIEDWQNV